MLCKNPFVHGGTGLPFGCGGCLPCLIKRRRIWASRIMLESYKHSKNCFVTLTYNEDNEPDGRTLNPKHLQDFIKRLRKNIAPDKFRYYACGEYGEQHHRPHYHAALFGLGHEDTEAIDKSWGHGYIYVGDLTKDSASYVAGYVTKKLSNPNNPNTEFELSGRHPEFARMSLKPGIGASAVQDIADTLTTPAGCDALAEIGDVPDHLLLEKKQVPLGKYIRGKLREKLGFPDKKTPDISIERWKEEMRQLYKDHESNSQNTQISQYFDKSQKFKYYLIDKNKQKVLQLETKNKIFSAKKDKL